MGALKVRWKTSIVEACVMQYLTIPNKRVVQPTCFMHRRTFPTKALQSVKVLYAFPNVWIFDDPPLKVCPPGAKGGGVTVEPETAVFVK